MSEHHRRLERIYLGAACNRSYGPTIVVGAGEARVAIPVRPDLFHAANAVHGSVVFKALDDAGFFAANSLVEDAFVLTSAFQLHFLRPIDSGEIRAVGRVVHASGRTFLADSVATDATGRVIARGTGTFVRSGISLPA